MQFAEHVLTRFSNSFISRWNAGMMEAGIKVWAWVGGGIDIFISLTALTSLLKSNV